MGNLASEIPDHFSQEYFAIWHITARQHGRSRNFYVIKRASWLCGLQRKHASVSILSCTNNLNSYFN